MASASIRYSWTDRVLIGLVAVVGIAYLFLGWGLGMAGSITIPEPVVLIVLGGVLLIACAPVIGTIRSEYANEAYWRWCDERHGGSWVWADCRRHDCRNLPENWMLGNEEYEPWCMYYETPPGPSHGDWQCVCRHYAWDGEYPEGREALENYLLSEAAVIPRRGEGE